MHNSLPISYDPKYSHGHPTAAAMRVYLEDKMMQIISLTPNINYFEIAMSDRTAKYNLGNLTGSRALIQPYDALKLAKIAQYMPPEKLCVCKAHECVHMEGKKIVTVDTLYYTHAEIIKKQLQEYKDRKENISMHVFHIPYKKGMLYTNEGEVTNISNYQMLKQKKRFITVTEGETEVTYYYYVDQKMQMEMKMNASPYSHDVWARDLITDDKAYIPLYRKSATEKKKEVLNAIKNQAENDVKVENTINDVKDDIGDHGEEEEWEDVYTMEEMLEQGFKIKKIKGDGWCLYHALLQLAGYDSSQKSLTNLFTTYFPETDILVIEKETLKGKDINDGY